MHVTVEDCSETSSRYSRPNPPTGTMPPPTPQPPTRILRPIFLPASFVLGSVVGNHQSTHSSTQGSSQYPRYPDPVADATASIARSTNASNQHPAIVVTEVQDSSAEQGRGQVQEQGQDQHRDQDRDYVGPLTADSLAELERRISSTNSSVIHCGSIPVDTVAHRVSSVRIQPSRSQTSVAPSVVVLNRAPTVRSTGGASVLTSVSRVFRPPVGCDSESTIPNCLGRPAPESVLQRQIPAESVCTSSLVSSAQGPTADTVQRYLALRSATTQSAASTITSTTSAIQSAVSIRPSATAMTKYNIGGGGGGGGNGGSGSSSGSGSLCISVASVVDRLTVRPQQHPPNCQCQNDPLWQEQCRNLFDAEQEFHVCIALSQNMNIAMVRQQLSMLKDAPLNPQLQRLWYHSKELCEYIGELETFMDKTRVSLEEHARQWTKRRIEVEDSERQLRHELDVVKTRALYSFPTNSPGGPC
ncbi:hypothetical protein BG011_009960 [Mortierella polycephala]|uniref:Uncharacterized protein n=1 Tax=Mortierella polycephala TaxID=41804 RepID=A0A9P6U6H8_9FUNG|nr:hypothetical protein BG011_009960 [Mortierella polycephala]